MHLARAVVKMAGQLLLALVAGFKNEFSNELADGATVAQAGFTVLLCWLLCWHALYFRPMADRLESAAMGLAFALEGLSVLIGLCANMTDPAGDGMATRESLAMVRLVLALAAIFVPVLLKTYEFAIVNVSRACRKEDTSCAHAISLEAGLEAPTLLSRGPTR